MRTASQPSFVANQPSDQSAIRQNDAHSYPPRRSQPRLGPTRPIFQLPERAQCLQQHVLSLPLSVDAQRIFAAMIVDQYQVLIQTTLSSPMTRMQMPEVVVEETQVASRAHAILVGDRGAQVETLVTRCLSRVPMKEGLVRPCAAFQGRRIAVSELFPPLDVDVLTHPTLGQGGQLSGFYRGLADGDQFRIAIYNENNS